MSPETSVRSLRRADWPAGARALIVARTVGRFGDGAYYVTAALYFTRVVGLRPVQLGAVLSAGWVLVLVLTVPIGHGIDRLGPRRCAVVMNVCAGLAIVEYLFVHSVWLVAIGAAVYALSSQTAQSAQAALLGEIVTGEERARVRARLISRANAGLALGAAAGGVALAVGSQAAFYAVFAVDALSFIGAACVVSLVRPPAAIPRAQPKGRMFAVLRDRRFAAVCAVNVFLVLHLPLIDVALPLYIVRRTHAVHWVIAAIFVVNTSIVVFLQEAVARRVPNLRRAIRVLPAAGALLLLSCIIYAIAAANTTPTIATIILLTAAVVMTFGEMVQTSATGEISYGLTPDGSHGSYQNLFGSGLTVAEAVGPLALTSLLVTGGPWGWLVLGGVFLLGSIAMFPVVAGAVPYRDAIRVGDS